MSSETFAFLAASVMVAGSCALLFVADSRRAFSGRYMNLWLTASMLVVLCAASYLTEAELDHPSLVVALANGAMVGAVGFVWLGCRSFNQVPFRFGWVGVAVLLIMLLTVLQSSLGSNWSGMFPKMLGLSAFSALTAIESRRGAFGSFRVSWVMTIAHALYASYAGARAAVLGLRGHDDVVFENYFSVEVMTILSLVFALVNTIVLVFVRIEELVARRGNGAPGCYTSLRRLATLHRQLAGSVVLGVEILDFRVIRHAYGVAHAQELVTRLFYCVLECRPDALAIASDRGGVVSVLLAEPHVHDDFFTALRSEYLAQSSGLADGYASTLRITVSTANDEARLRQNGAVPPAAG
ncbi:hypothetical protein SAMN06295909_2508 [Plantibacter sp. VKM Ac-1784]|uniref:GGDEF domain-containing protein n=1 Tax=Plantibacter elymi (nom. nud.) TaxID=199708 RepID=A0ABY1REI1_9MICO|nr:hypothetical protein [Plantibacter sp. VKM Ac-1784]SMQ71248.1 hypothetical protein SAMN06295909_2508 [Plantibacter sp. VKM Ac-1784]